MHDTTAVAVRQNAVAVPFAADSLSEAIRNQIRGAIARIANEDFVRRRYSTGRWSVAGRGGHCPEAAIARPGGLPNVGGMDSGQFNCRLRTPVGVRSRKARVPTATWARGPGLKVLLSVLRAFAHLPDAWLKYTLVGHHRNSPRSGKNSGHYDHWPFLSVYFFPFSEGTPHSGAARRPRHAEPGAGLADFGWPGLRGFGTGRAGGGPAHLRWPARPSGPLRSTPVTPSAARPSRGACASGRPRCLAVSGCGERLCPDLRANP